MNARRMLTSLVPDHLDVTFSLCDFDDAFSEPGFVHVCEPAGLRGPYGATLATVSSFDYADALTWRNMRRSRDAL